MLFHVDQGAGAMFEGWVRGGGSVQDRRGKMIFCNEACRNECTGPGNPISKIFQRLETRNWIRHCPNNRADRRGITRYTYHKARQTCQGRVITLAMEFETLLT